MTQSSQKIEGSSHDYSLTRGKGSGGNGGGYGIGAIVEAVEKIIDQSGKYYG